VNKLVGSSPDISIDRVSNVKMQSQHFLVMTVDILKTKINPQKIASKSSL